MSSVKKYKSQVHNVTLVVICHTLNCQLAPETTKTVQQPHQQHIAIIQKFHKLAEHDTVIYLAAK